ncbi:hypothetical protein WICPIJ_002993 [Wickerhamomyces pijperi]|uniref:Clathrin light chain n=1 Tax=Wickerhamomyces pijperi TaxID=599730 RepID=A0A9P8QAQ3_WICPI|nr:hypothetical protein WICPIJ_002993 [Wickerhamomyces pijperi]
MADKFPEIDAEIPINSNEDAGDFLAREKALLGEDATQFQTEGDDDLLKGSTEDEDDELKKFEEQFPTVLDEEPVQEEKEQEEEEFDEPVFNAPQTQGQSDAVKQWRERYQLEISTRDANDAAKSEEIKTEAAKQLDDFYQDYNDKKDSSIAKVREAEKEFLDKRDAFYAKGEVWERALELVEGVKGEGNLRFKEVLKAKVRAVRD